MKISLVIPMYNEMSIVDEAAATFSGYLAARFDEWELIFVDDGSTDGCGKAITQNWDEENIKLISYQPNRGKGYAVRQGMLAATGDIIIFTDCDNAYGTAVIGQMIKRFMLSDADIIVGSRNMSKSGYDGYTFLRRVASKTYIRLINLIAGFGKYHLSDSQCGFKGFRREAAKKIFANCEVDRFAFDLEAIMIGGKCGYKFAQMPVKIIHHRESKVNVWKDAVRMIGDVRRMKKRIKKLEIK
ncbi:MAG: glycosyltransferase [Clostridia bacterium]|nr:glycosyltransferase [Clostridia bacterium]